MAWYAFPTTCAKIRIETLINAILHKKETHMEVIHRLAEHRKHFWRPPSPSPSAQSRINNGRLFWPVFSHILSTSKDGDSTPFWVTCSSVHSPS